MTESLCAHMDTVKQFLAHCDDLDVAMAVWRDCREAEAQLQQLTQIAADVTDKLAMRTDPADQVSPPSVRSTYIEMAKYLRGE